MEEKERESGNEVAALYVFMMTLLSLIFLKRDKEHILVKNQYLHLIA